MRAIWPKRRWLAIAAAAALLAVETAPSMAGAVPSPGGGSALAGVACASPSACWSVGSYGNDQGALVNEALGWDGVRWSVAATPDPGGTRQFSGGNESQGVACASASECFAVGVYYKGFGASAVGLNEVLLWNGSKWSLSLAPNPGGHRWNRGLSGVACASPSECFAVGAYATGTGTSAVSRSEILRWNGSKWSLAATPDPGGTVESHLAGVTCTSTSECFAVGSYRNSTGVAVDEVLRWNGRNWSVSMTPNSGGAASSHELVGVACSSPHQCLAVGDFARGRAGPFSEALRWNGTKWLLHSPAGHEVLDGVACSSASVCFAVGGSRIFRWNGTEWSLAARQPGQFAGVTCSSASRCFAVGQYVNGGGRNEILDWNGTTWSAG